MAALSAWFVLVIYISSHMVRAGDGGTQDKQSTGDSKQQPPPPGPAPSGNNASLDTGAIIGIVVGTLVIIALIILIIVICLRKRQGGGLGIDNRGYGTLDKESVISDAGGKKKEVVPSGPQVAGPAMAIYDNPQEEQLYESIKSPYNRPYQNWGEQSAVTTSQEYESSTDYVSMDEPIGGVSDHIRGQPTAGGAMPSYLNYQGREPPQTPPPLPVPNLPQTPPPLPLPNLPRLPPDDAHEYMDMDGKNVYYNDQKKQSKPTLKKMPSSSDLIQQVEEDYIEPVHVYVEPKSLR